MFTVFAMARCSWFVLLGETHLIIIVLHTVVVSTAGNTHPRWPHLHPALSSLSQHLAGSLDIL